MAPLRAAGLQGYSLPLSPTGTSSLVPPPPWHFSGDAIWIEYRVDPDAAAAFLPPGLRMGADPGLAAIGFYDWQWCGDAQEHLRDPARAQFRECLIALDCALDDEPVARVPYAWVDDVVPLVRGLFQGMPKLPGSIAMTRTFPVGRAAARREAGSRFTAVASAGRTPLASATVTLDGPLSQTPPLADRPLIHTRHLPAWEPGEPPLEELVRSSTSDVQFADMWQGSAELEFSTAGDPDLATLAPVEVGAGYVFSYAETLRPGHRVQPRMR
jgi:enduracididine biosynthesis enzyme MppR